MTHSQESRHREDLPYWLEDQPIQNFGDYLTAYLAAKLFVRTPRRTGQIRIIGSCLADSFVEVERLGADSTSGSSRFALTAWACGVREPGGLSMDIARYVDILSVRGPLSASELRLGAAVPIGDPGLLMPALYRPRRHEAFAGVSLCIPHFHETRTDAEIVASTGADRVLRPNIRQSLAAIEDFIDALTSAEFVLCASLHAAIVAAAYGTPFAFWDSGNIDLPFKWSDFAASVGIPDQFHRDVASGHRHYLADIEPVIRLPAMWKTLAVAPFFLRPSALLSVYRLELQKAHAAHEPTPVDEIIRIFESRIPQLEQIASDSNSIIDELASRAAVLSSELTRAREAADLSKLLSLRIEGLEAASSATTRAVHEVAARCDGLIAELARAQDAAARAQAAEARAQDSEARAQASEARALDSDARAQASEAEAQDSEARAQASEAKAQDSEARARASEAQAEDSGTRAQAMSARVDELLEASAREQAELRAAQELAGSLSGQIDALSKELEVTRADASDIRDRLIQFEQELTRQTRSMDRAADEFAAYDTRPWRLVGRHIAHAVLTELATWRRLLPQRMRERFTRSAAKRESGQALRRWRALQESLQAITEATAPAAHRPARAIHPTESTVLNDLQAAFRVLHGSEAIHFPPVTDPKVSVIIPAYKRLDELLTCLRSLSVHRATEPSFEVIVIDDCPSESVLWALPASGGLRTEANETNLGFLLSCRRGAELARGQVLCFLNSDTIVTAGWLAALVDALGASSRIGLVGSLLLNRDGSIQDAGWRILDNGWGHPMGRGADAMDGMYTHRRPVDCVTGACFVITAKRWRDVDGFDPVYSPAFYEEFDLAFRLRQMGYETIYEPHSRVVHLGSASYGSEERDRLSGLNHAKFVERFRQQLGKQPRNVADAFRTLWAGPRRPVILIVDLSIPEPDRHAGDVTMFSYIGILVESGWRVVFGPRRGQTVGPHAKALEEMGVEIVRPPVDVETWLLRHGAQVDHVLLCRPEVATELLGPVRATSRARLSYYTHDLHSLRLEREAELHADPDRAHVAAEVKVQEFRVLQSVDQILTPSRYEAQVIETLLPGSVPRVVQPYFFASSEIVHRDAADLTTRVDILFVGGFPHVPNVDAALFIVREIMPLIWRAMPEARLLLVGYAPPPEVRALAGPRVVVTGQVPDLAPWFARSRLMLAALRYGAGVKGKVVEALRQGLPVVATPAAAEGIGITSGREALIYEDPAELASAALELLKDPDLCSRMSRAGAELVRANYSRRAARIELGRVFEMHRCGVCGSTRTLTPPQAASVRDRPVCEDCSALGLTEALARVMRDRIGLGGEAFLAQAIAERPELQLHEFGTEGAIAETLRGYSNYSNSELFDGVPAVKAGADGATSDDLSLLTCADSRFDLTISQCVSDPVPDPALALAAAASVLRPGGRHFFTIPRSGFGMDLSAIVAAAGLSLVEHEIGVGESPASEVLRVFEAVKPLA